MQAKKIQNRMKDQRTKRKKKKKKKKKEEKEDEAVAAASAMAWVHSGNRRRGGNLL